MSLFLAPASAAIAAPTAPAPAATAAAATAIAATAIAGTAVPPASPSPPHLLLQVPLLMLLLLLLLLPDARAQSQRLDRMFLHRELIFFAGRPSSVSSPLHSPFLSVSHAATLSIMILSSSGENGPFFKDLARRLPCKLYHFFPHFDWHRFRLLLLLLLPIL
ncbi:hypothetical protein B484DRAFT_441501 [Ochromonadaceae sp. CCMP2298]|nr:hypothetical protein B484DRAFT_441501 [Ochromonadaceae sp. CCMP2298]